MPEINGVLGYSIATLAVLVIVGTVVTYGLSRLDVGYVACFSALALILVRPVLFPQFTINAGLLLMGAIICWLLYAQQNDKRVLLAGCILAFLSYLVRSHSLSAKKAFRSLPTSRFLDTSKPIAESISTDS